MAWPSGESAVIGRSVSLAPSRPSHGAAAVSVTTMRTEANGCGEERLDGVRDAKLLTNAIVAGRHSHAYTPAAPSAVHSSAPAALQLFPRCDESLVSDRSAAQVAPPKHSSKARIDCLDRSRVKQRRLSFGAARQTNSISYSSVLVLGERARAPFVATSATNRLGSSRNASRQTPQGAVRHSFGGIKATTHIN